MAARIKLPEHIALLKHQHCIYDDFSHIVSADLWTPLVADSTATVTVGDAAGGICAIFTDTTDENEAGLITTHEIFKCAAGKPIKAGASFQFTDLTGNGANVAFGFGNAMGANTLLDAGAGVNTSFTTCFFLFKVDGGTVWKLHSENGADVETFTSTVTAGGSSYTEVEVDMNAVDGAIDEYEVVWQVDGNYFYDSNGRIVKHRISYASATEMDFGLYGKTGTSGEALTVNCNWIYAIQGR